MIDQIMENEALTRQMFKQLNKAMLLMWRLGLGPLLQHPTIGYITVLTTTGRKTGLQRQAPINYARDDDTVYLLPGFGKRTHWYLNLIADPQCSLWLPDGLWSGAAEEITDPEEHLQVLRRVLVRAGFATRLIEGFNPAYISRDHLRELAEARYPVSLRVRLRLDERRPKRGNLLWVWPALVVLVLALRGLARSDA